MKTPLKPGIDDEIYEVEARISRRRAELPRVARATGKSALHALASPAGLAAAAAVGFLAGGGLRRANGHAKPTVERRKAQHKRKGIAVGSLLMSGAIALIKAQFGSPLHMAQAALSRIQPRKGARTSPRGPSRASPRSDRRPVAG